MHKFRALDFLNKNYERSILGFAAIWYSITAFYSNGYYHADEHYQIIEFARFISGENSPSEMAWEFHDRIRSAIQPTFCFLLFKLFNFFTLTNPYTQAFLLRLITGLFSVFTISYFSLSCKPMVSDKYWKIFYFISFFIWFLPFLNVRFSSETYSGLIFLWTLSIILRNKKQSQHYLIIGCLIGISFLFRFQTIALSFGLILWLILIKKEKKENIYYLLFASGVAVLAGITLDCWFYNKIIFTPWNYFLSNIVNGKAASFGTFPWYYYIYYIFRFSFFPLGILTLLSFLILFYKKPSNIFIWTIVPFIVIHSLITHKELRFIFPIINLAPILLILSYQVLKENQIKKISEKFINVFFIITAGINQIAIFPASLKPAGLGYMEITKTIHERKDFGNIRLVYINNSNPYDPWIGLPAQFYMEKNIRFENLQSMNLEMNDSSDCIYFVLMKQDINKPKVQEIISKQHLVKITESIPEWMEILLHIYGGFNTNNILVLYKVT